MARKGAARLHPRARKAEVAIASRGLGLVKGTDENEAALPAANGDEIIGVSLDSAEADENITYQPLIPGVEVEVVAGAAVARDALIAAQTNGRFITPAAASGQKQQLQALEAATGAGDIITAVVLADAVTA